MVKKVLYLVDRLIHKFIPHPPCDKLHIARPMFATTTNTATGTTDVHWTYKS